MVLTVRFFLRLSRKCPAHIIDLLDFADLIGPGGKGLKRDRADSDEDDGEDSDEDDLDEFDLSEGEESDEEDEGDSEADTDPDDLISEGEPSELLEEEESSQGEAEIDLSENEASESEPQEEEEKAAVPATKYVPPHMRAAQLAEKAQGSKEKALSRQKLERKLQGLLNKSVSLLHMLERVLMIDCQRRIWIVSLVVSRRFIGTTVGMVCPPCISIADDRRDDNNHGLGPVGSLIQGQPARLIRLALRSICRCSPPYNRCRVWYVPLPAAYT